MSSLIFITGGTGFIGSQTVHDTLQAGHRVRLSIRREGQVEEVKRRFPNHGSQLEFALVPDIGDSIALRAALKDDVDYIFHLASPMPGKGEDFKTEYLKPAVDGTEAILAAAAETPSVKRVVIMSSLLALIPLGGLQVPGLEIKESSNPSLVVDPDAQFPAGPAGYGAKYSASKILAHRATLEWMAARNPHFSLVTVHPTFVLGHDKTQTDPTRPGGINAFLLRSLATPPPGKPMTPAAFVDVRDVSSALLRSLDLEVEKGVPVTEILVNGNPTSWDEIIKFVKTRYPMVEVKLQGPFDAPFTADTSRAEKNLGIRWRSIKEMLAGVFDQQMELRSHSVKAGL
ncbi:putative reductase [Podospora aff. communis PSN243]|uniref:Reductase n=1 Tax=Podospora aff. communis PSN243 TaxID=3040156 RepID=A0AAV9GFZ7_9PEZI|nr:putative reductase [Podospora aff. communis PSN243]